MVSRFLKLFLFVISLASVAAQGAPIMFDNTDISPMVDYFRKQVVTLDKAVTTYNWAPRQADDVPERPQDDPAVLEKVQDLAGSFWRGYGSKGSGMNMYGYGLYTAADPVATADYGGGGDNWRLIQIEFPVGTRMFDLGKIDSSAYAALTNAAEDVEQKFGCPRAQHADHYLRDGGEKLSPKCRQLVYEVFNNILKIDAFAYGYYETQFTGCSNWYPRAFVVTRPDWMRSNYVHVYTAESRLNEKERIRIQTLFLKSLDQAATLQPLRDAIAKYLDAHPNHELQSSKTVCANSTCVITAQFCNAAKQCDAVPLPPLPRPGGPTITAAEAKQTQLLWPDLIGKPKATTISVWLKNNMFGCSGELPYQVK